jgi:excisionase family DNA binding protein
MLFRIKQGGSMERKVESNATFITAKQCAELIGCSMSSLYRLTCSSAIPHFKYRGHGLRFKREEVEVWLSSQLTKVPTGSELTNNAVKHFNRKEMKL